MGNTPSLEGENKDKYIEEQKKIIREQQDQIQKLASIAENGMKEEKVETGQPKKISSKPKINPYKELNIGNNYDENSLKKAYLKKAMETHPDRGGSKETFQRVTVSYKALMLKLKNDRDSHEHNELRENSSDFLQQQTHENKRNINQPNLSKNFNNNVFNQIYEENKIEEVYDDGYGDWMKKNSYGDGSIEGDPSLTRENFNNRFSKSKQRQLSKKGKQIKEYSEPIEEISYKNKSSIMVLGQGKVKDFSGESGGLSFRDYKDAYTNTYLVEDKVVDSSRPKDLKETEKQRSNVSFVMDEETERKYSLKKIKEEQAEKLRLERLQNNDTRAFNMYDKVHQRMIG